MQNFYLAKNDAIKKIFTSSLVLSFSFLIVSFFITSIVFAQTKPTAISAERQCTHLPVKLNLKPGESLPNVISVEQQQERTKRQTEAAQRGSEFFAPCVNGNILVDGGFETTNSTTLVNPSWPSTSTNFGTPFCNAAGCGNGGGTANARTGTFWCWFGGITGAEAGSIQQSVVIPAGATNATLNFYLWVGFVTAPFDATMKVMVDGVTVQTITEPSVAESGYTLRSVNLSAYANDAAHTIRFEYNQSSGSGNSNFNLDDVTLDMTCAVLPPCTGVPSPGTIGASASSVCSGSPVTLTLSGYTPGVSGLGFQWKSSSTPGGPYIIIPGATNNTYTFNPTSTAYYINTVTCSNGGGAANTTEVGVAVSNMVHSNVIATPATACTPGTTVITGSVSGGVLTGGSGVIGNSGTINLAIPDNSPAGISSTINLPATAFATANDLKIRINAGHSWVGDVKFTLTSPCGTTFLFDRPGVPASTFGNSNNLGSNNAASPPSPPPAVYTFDLSAATVIPETALGSGFIPTGNYKPSDVAGAAHNWAGLTFPCAGAGNWTLTVSDNGAGDIGTLISWQILGPSTNYSHSLSGPGTIAPVVGSGPNNNTFNFGVSGLPAGTHTFTVTSFDVIGCSVSTNVTVTVNPTPAITITPAAPVICAGAIQQITANVVPGITQTFSSAALNVAIPDNSPAGLTTAPIVLPSGVNISSAANLSIRINAGHSWVGDLKFSVTSPCGTTFLFDRPGVPLSTFGNSNNLGTNSAASPPSPPPAVYIFDLSGATVIPETALGSGFVPTGTYKPSDVAGAAHNWAGLTFPCSGTGNWTLTVSDNGAGDIGTLIDWAILYTVPSPVTFSPTTNLYTDNLATVAYTGTPVNVVYAKPPTTATYTASSTIGGCTSTANVTVTVNQLPAITTQPTPATQTICPGFNVVYTVTATGAGLTYQWYKDGSILNNGGFVSGATTNTLTLSTVSSANTGSYYVIVSGTCTPAATSNTVVLNVATTPTITTQPASITVCQNANAVFSVVAAGVPTPTIYQWQSLTSPSVTWVNLTTGGSYTPTLTLTNVQPALSGTQYRVIITNSCGQTITSNAATLTVSALTTVVATDLWTRRICISDTLIPLVGTPVGGAWSGIGVSGFNFIPATTAVGTYVLTYTYTNASNCTYSDTTKVIVSDCAERVRLLKDDGVILFPNPNNGKFNVKINSTLYNYIGMKVYNSAGQLVNGTTVNKVLTSPTYTGLTYGRVIPIDLSYLPPGTYLVKFYYDDGIRTSEKTFKVAIVH